MKQALILVIALAAANLSAKAQTEKRAEGRRAIEAVVSVWQDGWNRHDIDALASLMDEDVDFITVIGTDGWLKSRKEFKDRHVQLHETRFKESVWRTKETQIRFIRPSLVIAHN